MSISQARETNLNNKEPPFFAYNMSAEKNVELSFKVWEQAPKSVSFEAKFFGIF